jgi:LPXTG-motif cell wall-anchored protein
MVAAVIGLAGPAGANTGHVVTAQNCDTWSVSVTLDSNVTSDHFVEITTTIPGTTGMVDGHYNTIGHQGTTQIWSANGQAVTSGTVTLTILNPNRTLDSQSSASLPGASECTTTTTEATTTTTYPETTTTTHHGCGCSTTTTQPVTTTTHPHCECSTTTTQPVTTTTEAETTTTQAETTTTQPESTTTTQPVTTTTSKVRELGSTTIVTTTTHPKASTTLADAGSTVAPTTTPVSGVLPHTGSSTTFPVIFGGMCLAAGAALALRKRSAWSRP